MGTKKDAATAATETAQSATATTALANIDISSNTEVGELLTAIQTTPGAFNEWENESNSNFTWPEKELVVCFIDGFEEVPDAGGKGTYEAVSFRVVVNGMPVTSYTNGDAVFLNTAKRMQERGKIPGLCSVYWNGEIKQPDPKRNGYKVLDIRAPKQ